jgi:hypothetical protein
MTHKNHFTVLEGGRDKQATVNNLSLAIIPDSHPSLPVDIRVFEDDTHLVLTVDPVMRYTEEHPIRLMTKIMETKPRKPGSIITNSNRWYAIIHDLDAEPSWRHKWIEDAYLAALKLGETKHVQRIRLPLLGSVHGNFSPERSLEILIQVIKSLTFQHLNKILILVPHQDCEKTKQYLQKVAQ